jgi:hypothetical protein
VPADSLTSQLQRIGPFAAVCVVLALALGTFALLKRIVPPPAKTPAPTTLVPSHTHIVVPPASPSAAAATGAGDPLAKAETQTLKGLTRGEHQQVRISRQQATAVAHGLAAARHRSGTIRALHVAHRAATPSARTSPAPRPEKKTAPTRTPTGGVGLPKRLMRGALIARSAVIAALSIFSLAQPSHSAQPTPVAIKPTAAQPTTPRTTATAKQPVRHHPKPTSLPPATQMSSPSLAATPTPGSPSLAKMIGQQMMLKFDGTSLDPGLLQRIHDGQVGGVILYGSNITSPGQVARHDTWHGSPSHRSVRPGNGSRGSRADRQTLPRRRRCPDRH